ncbi:MAG: hypothetical protein QM768_08985 [Agriterribacter sp.]
MHRIAGFIAIGLVGFILVCNFSKKDFRPVFNNSKLYNEVTDKLTKVNTYNIFMPPVTSRIYAYSHLAAYEVIVHTASSVYNSLGGQVKDLEKVSMPPQGKQAAQEAGISRYHEGLHYIKAIEVPADPGEKMGNLVSTKLKMKKSDCL